MSPVSGAISGGYIASVAQAVANKQMSAAEARAQLGLPAAPNSGAAFNDQQIAASGNFDAIFNRLTQAAANVGYSIDPYQPTAHTGVTEIVRPDGTRVNVPLDTGAGRQAKEEGDRSARAIITSTLAEYGLEALADWAWSMYLSGAPVEEIMLEVRKRPEYQTRFPGMEPLRREGRAISERDYIALERSFVQAARLYDLPKGFYDDPSDFGMFIANEVSPQEFGDTLGEWRQYADEIAGAPGGEEYVARMEAEYGITRDSGSFMALIYSAETGDERGLSAVRRRYQAGRIGAAAQRTGWGDLRLVEAEQIRGLGFEPAAAAERFGELARSQEVFAQLPGEQEAAFSREQQFAAGFRGNAAAQEAWRRRQRKRVTPFEGGGGFAAGRDGISGLGTAS